VSPVKQSKGVAARRTRERLDAYRSKRRKLSPNAAQSRFSFDAPDGQTPPPPVAVAENPVSVEDDFSLPIAIGRPSKKRALEESRMVIDVSLPPNSEPHSQSQVVDDERKSQPGLHPLASMDDRRLEALISIASVCLSPMVASNALRFPRRANYPE